MGRGFTSRKDKSNSQCERKFALTQIQCKQEKAVNTQRGRRVQSVEILILDPHHCGSPGDYSLTEQNMMDDKCQTHGSLVGNYQRQAAEV